MRIVVTQTPLGEIEAAERHPTRAIEECRETGWPPEVAWAEYHYAELLLGRDKAGGREMAVELQDMNVAIAQEPGMKPLPERLAAPREKLTAQAPMLPSQTLRPIPSRSLLQRDQHVPMLPNAGPGRSQSFADK